MGMLNLFIEWVYRFTLEGMQYVTVEAGQTKRVEIFHTVFWIDKYYYPMRTAMIDKFDIFC